MREGNQKLVRISHVGEERRGWDWKKPIRFPHSLTFLEFSTCAIQTVLLNLLASRKASYPKP